MENEQATPNLEESFVDLLKKIGEENAEIFFDSIDQLVNLLRLSKEDQKISYASTGLKQLNIIIGHRYCLVLGMKQEYPWAFISQHDIPTTSELKGFPFEGNPKALLFQSRTSKEVVERLAEIAATCDLELKRTKISRY